MLAQEPNVDVVYVTVGGGGLASGLATYIKAKRPQCRIVGCLPEKSPAMLECVKQGRVIDVPCYDTLSDGSSGIPFDILAHFLNFGPLHPLVLLGGIEEGSVTLDYCTRHVDEWQTVSEAEIAAALRFVLSNEHKLIEGAAAVSVAVAMREGARFTGANQVVFLCGANIATNTLVDVLTAH